MKVKRTTLLLLACLVWSAAGFNILRIGLSAYPPYRSAGERLGPGAVDCRLLYRPGGFPFVGRIVVRRSLWQKHVGQVQAATR